MKLIEGLGQHSISAEEVKILIRLLQSKSEDCYDNSTEFPYKSNVIHIISSIGKGGGYEHCGHYFDIQDSTEGITVPSIRDWPGPGVGFTFHCWLRLDNVNGGQGQRRQLYSFYTSSGQGLEAFITAEGDLVVSSAHKKDFHSTRVEDGCLGDGEWHSVSICQAAGKRPFGASQLWVYVDGRERKTSALKYPGFTEPFAYCNIGSQPVRANATSLTSDPASKLSIKANIKDAIKSSVPGVFSLPAYLKGNSSDPNIQWTMVGLDILNDFKRNLISFRSGWRRSCGVGQWPWEVSWVPSMSSRTASVHHKSSSFTTWAQTGS